MLFRRKLNNFLMIMMLALFPVQQVQAIELNQSVQLTQSMTIIGDVYDKVIEIYTKVKNMKNDIVNSVEDIFVNLWNKISEVITDLWNKISSMILGLDPSDVADSVVSEVSDLRHCKDLPSELDTIMEGVWEQTRIDETPLPNEVVALIKGVKFTDLGIIGIDPTSPDLTIDELYKYRRKTVAPLNALSGMAVAYFKIPFKIGHSLAVTCAGAAELALIKRRLALSDQGEEDLLIAQKDALIARIHDDLSSDKNRNIQFQLPHSAGGYLEDVRDVVTQSITSFEQLAMDVPSLSYSELEDANAEFQGGNYRAAYKGYQKAYDKLAKGKNHFMGRPSFRR